MSGKGGASLLLGKANRRIRKGTCTHNFQGVQTKLDTHAHAHTQKPPTNGVGKGSGDSRGEHDENSKGTAGFLTECREWAGKLSQQRECTKKRLGMQLRLRTNGEPNSKPKVREEKTKTQRPLTRSQKCFGFISKLGVMSRE